MRKYSPPIRGIAAAWVALVVVGMSQAASAATLVSISTSLGTIEIDLFDDLSSTTVDNFLNYVTSGHYTDTVVHRSTSIADTGLAVIQGGGFTYNSGTNSLTRNSTNGPIPLDYTADNVVGTIAMARTGDPNSATDQWFINTTDNSQVLNETNGGGFAVFGHIVGKGLSVAEQINNLPKQGFTPFNVNVPLRNFGGGTPDGDNLVFINSITVVGERDFSYQNPVLNADVVNDGILRVSDVHAVINDILANGVRNLDDPYAGGNYLDANGTNSVTSGDVQSVINALLAQSAAAAPAAAPLAAQLAFAASPFTAVPEPSSLALAAIAGLSLAAMAWRRQRRVRA